MTESCGVFGWGVASGDPTATSIVLWTRVDRSVGGASFPATLAWFVWELHGDSADTVQTGTAVPSADGATRVVVSGLTPGVRYAYRFEFDGRQSVVGSAATLDPIRDSIRLGVACCARLASGPLTAYEGLRLAEPDLVVHLGDYIYEDGGRKGDEGEPPQPSRECRTFDDYSARYAQYRRDGNLQRLHQSVPWVAMPDDHEITDDAFPPEHQTAASDVEAPSAERKADALSAHDRWMPQAAHGNGPTRFDRHIPLGRAGDLIMLDTRFGGRQEPAGSGPTAVQNPADRPEDAPSSRRSLLDDAQWDWIDQVIGATDGSWVILASQVQVAPLRLGWLPQLAWPPRLRRVVNPDQWDGYPADRGRLVDLLDRHEVSNVLILSGDLHSRFVTTIERGSGPPVVEVTTPSVSAPTFASLIERRIPLPARWRTWRLVARWIRLINPHIIDMDLAGHGTSVLDVAVDSITITGLSPAGQPTKRWKVTSTGVSTGQTTSTTTGPVGIRPHP